MTPLLSEANPVSRSLQYLKEFQAMGIFVKTQLGHHLRQFGLAGLPSFFLAPSSPPTAEIAEG